MKQTPRAYQLAIYHSILEKGNTLVVLPTGMGKTLIALMLIDKFRGRGRCLFLTPTKPLAKQHYESIKEIIEVEDKDIELMTGDKPADKRKELYKKNIIVATPQTIANDIENGIAPRDFVLCIFDECHRAVGDYAYVKIAAALPNALIVGMTASPGGKKERITEVLENLKIKNVEIRTSQDPDVSPYIKKSTIKWIGVDLSPTLREIKNELDTLVKKYSQELAALGFPPPLKHKGQFMLLGEKIRNIPTGKKYPAMVKYYALMNVLHLTELLETQGLHAMRTYLEKVDTKESKSAKMLLKTPEIAEIKKIVYGTEEEHPKLKKLVELVKELRGKKIIVFAQYRDQIKKIEDELKKNGIAAKQFVGRKDGVTRKQQEETIAEFRDDKFSVLVASSIGEEGLDIPKVDAVIFYEPIPSEIRSIQRRGRAARLKEGEVYILMTRGTRDEYYYWASINREKKMKQILYAIQAKQQRDGNVKKIEKKDENVNIRKIGQTKISHFF
ncbi:MAG: DEAD/DEAH box helicase family protein [Candidatus Bilamarchaeaceae archaeon]